MAKRKHKFRAPIVRVGERPTPERRKRNGGVTSEAINCDASRNILILRYKARVECKLDAYFLYGYLTKAEYLAGRKFRSIYFSSLEKNEYGCRFGTFLSFGSSPHNKVMLDEAYLALSPGQKSAVIHVCGHDIWMTDNQNLDIFKQALSALSELWGFRKPTQCNDANHMEKQLLATVIQFIERVILMVRRAINRRKFKVMKRYSGGMNKSNLFANRDFEKVYS